MARRLIIRLRMLALKNWMERRRVRSVTRANGGRQRLDAEPHQCWRGTGMHAREHIHIDVTQMVATRPYGIRPTGWTSGAWIEELKPPKDYEEHLSRSMKLAGRLLNRRASQFALFKFVSARPRRAKSRPGCDHTAWWCEVIRGPRSAARVRAYRRSACRS